MPTEFGIQESREACLYEDVLMSSLRMWLVCRRATGKQARPGRESASKFATALMLLVNGLGEERFRILYPDIAHEISCLMERV